jgi:hypothetical protein
LFSVTGLDWSAGMMAIAVLTPTPNCAAAWWHDIPL